VLGLSAAMGLTALVALLSPALRRNPLDEPPAELSGAAAEPASGAAENTPVNRP
jgi:hypothetical protein